MIVGEKLVFYVNAPKWTADTVPGMHMITSPHKVYFLSSVYKHGLSVRTCLDHRLMTSCFGMNLDPSGSLHVGRDSS